MSSGVMAIAEPRRNEPRKSMASDMTNPFCIFDLLSNLK
jgi:hypothetical protein